MRIQTVAAAPIAGVAHKLNRIPARLRFSVFLIGTIAIALGLTALSYWLYLSSGTAQLDLSRPGYKQALSEVGPSDDSTDYSYSSSGPLNKSALDDFKQKYDALAAKTKGYSAFDPGALSDEQLNLTASAAQSPPSGTTSQ